MHSYSSTSLILFMPVLTPSKLQSLWSTKYAVCSEYLVRMLSYLVVPDFPGLVCASSLPTMKLRLTVNGPWKVGLTEFPTFAFVLLRETLTTHCFNQTKGAPKNNSHTMDYSDMITLASVNFPKPVDRKFQYGTAGVSALPLESQSQADLISV